VKHGLLILTALTLASHSIAGQISVRMNDDAHSVAFDL